jgi:hypothetical protein
MSFILLVWGRIAAQELPETLVGRYRFAEFKFNENSHLDLRDSASYFPFFIKLFGGPQQELTERDSIEIVMQMNKITREMKQIRWEVTNDSTILLTKPHEDEMAKMKTDSVHIRYAYFRDSGYIRLMGNTQYDFPEKITVTATGFWIKATTGEKEEGILVREEDY